MNRLYQFLFVAVASVALLSCAREVEQAQAIGETITFTATVPQSRTQLGEPDGNVWPNLWSEGDAISVNGVASAPLTAEQAGSSSASFTVEGVSAPYEAVYPAGATEIPTEQTYVEGSYDPAAFLMRASSQDASLAFEAEVAIFKFTPTGEGDAAIASVSINGYKMEAQQGVALGQPWFVAFAPGDYTQTGITVVVTDTDGGAMLRNATPNKAYEAGKMYSASLEYVPDPEIMNVYGSVTCGGAGVPGVLVSDGINIYETDEAGHYAFHSEKKWQNVFITIPTGYEVPLNGVQPQFYKPLSGDVNVMEQADFELIESPVTDFRLLVLGDMHLARRTGDLEQFAKVARSIEKQMNAAPGKVYALTLGDHAWDMYWISNNFNLTDYLNTLNETFGGKGVPFFFTMGNHDNEMEKSDDVPKALAYIHTIAPTYYSFNLGQVHFIVLDNMDFRGVESGKDNRSKYKKNFTADQLEWLRQDLSHVSKSTPVFVSAHEPMAVPDGLGWKEELDGEDADKAEFLAIFDGYKVEMITGHTHSIFNRELSPTFHEHNYGAVCGTWWWSGYLTPGIHIGQEGSPGGMGVFDFSGTSFTHYYQAACHERDYQFRAYDMNQVKEFLTEDYANGHSDWTKYYNYIQGFAANVIYLNVWDWDENWNVEVLEGDTPLTVTRVGGAYDPLHIAAFTGPRLRRSDAQGTSPSFQTRKWNHYFKATASSATSTVTVRVTDRYGNVFQEVMERPKAFNMDEYKNEAARTGLVAECFSTSSSTLAFKWTQGDSDADDMSSPYKASLYSDQALTDLVMSFDIPASASCWSGNGTRFVIGGLTPSTTYWFQVQDTKTGEKSAPVSAATDDFTVVVSSTLTSAAAGDVILAEDFSELGWNADMLASAAGFIPSHKVLGPLSGNYSEDNGKYQPYNNTSGRIYGETKVTSDKRLFNWGFFGNSSVYAYAGYFRVGASDSGARTHIVSPALSCIPEGKLATVDVTVTSCLYESSENDVAVFLEDYTALKHVLDPDQTESTNPKFSSQGGKFTGASLSDGYPLEVPVKQWATKTVRIEGVTNKNCLIFGSYKNVDKKNRFFISDVKVQIVSIEDKPEEAPIQVECQRTSSSTLIFTWTEGNGASADVANAYTATLYRDAACTQVDQSFDFPEGLGAWKGKQPKYIFGGLTPSTDYWLKVYDTTNNLESAAIKGTTDAFTIVEMPESITGTGVALAEDFGEIRWEFDHITTAVGFRPKDNTDFANTEVKTSETNTGSYIYNGYHYSGGGEMTFKGPTTALNNSRLKDWLSDTNVYLHPGYLKLGTSSTRGWVVTPEFKIPEGKTATVTVTITAARLNSSQDSDWCVVVLNPELAKADPSAHTASFDWPDDEDQTLYQLISFSNTDWATKSVSGLVLRNGDRIAFGGKHGGGEKAGRAYISDLTVTVTAIEDGNRTVKVSVIGDSISTFKGWCDTTKGGAYYPKSDCDVSSVSDTWWYRLIYNKMSYGIFEKNISAGNTTIVQNTTGDSSAYWYGWDFGTRLQTLGIGDPDVVLIHGGTNDYGHTSWYGTSEELIDGVAMNASSFPETSAGKLEELFADADAATTVAEADALDGKTFCSAYIRLIKMIQARCGSVKVVCLIGTYLRGGQREAILRIAEHFGEDNVRVADILGAGVSVPMYNNPHPNATGMANMADFVYQEVGDWIDVQ